MQNTRYFGIERFENYLRKNTHRASILKIGKKSGSEDIFVQPHDEHSFQFIERDFLANQSVTQGVYTRQKGSRRLLGRI